MKCTGEVKYGRPLRKIQQFPSGMSAENGNTWQFQNPVYTSHANGDKLLEHLLLRKSTELWAWGSLKTHQQIISGLKLHTMTKQRESTLG